MVVNDVPLEKSTPTSAHGEFEPYYEGSWDAIIWDGDIHIELLHQLNNTAYTYLSVNQKSGKGVKVIAGYEGDDNHTTNVKFNSNNGSAVVEDADYIYVSNVEPYIISTVTVNGVAIEANDPGHSYMIEINGKKNCVDITLEGEEEVSMVINVDGLENFEHLRICTKWEYDDDGYIKEIKYSSITDHFQTLKFSDFDFPLLLLGYYWDDENYLGMDVTLNGEVLRACDYQPIYRAYLVDYPGDGAVMNITLKDPNAVEPSQITTLTVNDSEGVLVSVESEDGTKSIVFEDGKAMVEAANYISINNADNYTIKSVKVDGVEVAPNETDSYYYIPITSETKTIAITVKKQESQGGNDVQCYFSAAKTEIASGKIGLLPISMVNDDSVIGIQFDVELSEGLSLAKDDNDQYYLESSSRFIDHYVYSSEIDGAVRFVIVSLNNYEFCDNNGVIFSIPIVANGEPRQADILINNIKISNAPGQEVDGVSVSTTINVLLPYTMGDANNDGKISIMDVTITIATILGNLQPSFVKEAADIDGNGHISIADVTGIIALILNQTHSNTNSARVPAMLDGISALRLEEFEFGEGSFNATVRLDNAAAYVGVQIDIEIPEGVSVTDVALNGSNRESHQLVYTMTEEGTLRVLVISMANSPLVDNNLLSLTFEPRIDENSDLIFDFGFSSAVELTANGVREIAINGESVCLSNLTGLSTMNTNSPIITVNGLTVTVYTSEETIVSITDLRGIHKNIEVSSGISTFKLPTRGLYLINGKKYFAK